MFYLHSGLYIVAVGMPSSSSSTSIALLTGGGGSMLVVAAVPVVTMWSLSVSFVPQVERCRQILNTTSMLSARNAKVQFPLPELMARARRS